MHLCTKSRRVREFVPIVVVEQNKPPRAQLCTIGESCAPQPTRAELATLFVNWATPTNVRNFGHYIILHINLHLAQPFAKFVSC